MPPKGLPFSPPRRAVLKLSMRRPLRNVAACLSQKEECDVDRTATGPRYAGL